MSTGERQERAGTLIVPQVDQSESQSPELYPKVGEVTPYKDTKASRRWGRRFRARELIGALLSPRF